MHEYSIVQSLIESSQEYVKENDATKVTKMVVKIGVLSGVEPDLLKVAFDTFKEDTPCEECEIILNIQKIKILCSSCKKESILEKNEFKCPYCDTCEIKVLDGEEMYLMQLELE
ncbi:MAG: hydrogenase maturation nickel metallochaperone HypA [Epsilonproteobacteria bacterium]|nr:MAG: hydrogenase maturation nickel metallochaperone HypA [Campylobacterota bacterium]